MAGTSCEGGLLQRGVGSGQVGVSVAGLGTTRPLCFLHSHVSLLPRSHSNTKEMVIPSAFGPREMSTLASILQRSLTSTGVSAPSCPVAERSLSPILWVCRSCALGPHVCASAH